MCNHGTYVMVDVINPNQNKRTVAVDSCIADEIRSLNEGGVITVGCCCGHGKAGQIVEYENGFGRWKSNESPPHSLIDSESVAIAESLGYRPFPYYYADGEYDGTYKMYLKTGDVALTKEDDE